MAIETTPVAGIQDLNAGYPLPGDPRHQGDDHFNLTKDALIKTFAGIISDAAIEGPVLVNTEELNLLQGLTADASELNLLDGRSLSSTDDVIDNFPATTAMLFYQTAAPSGWTAVAINDHALRVVTTGTTGGTTGGTNGFSTVLNTSVNVSGTALDVTHIPQHNHGNGTLGTDDPGDHTHTVNVYSSTSSGSNRQGLASAAASGAATALSAGAHTHNITGSTANWGTATPATHNHNFNLDVNFADLVMATKD